ncbi:hypothetical protein IAR55_002114 [Kwoniella newhampshirensis]|uniref:Uncharacterized protein n=1 Tax=Kwoniella newhampshirensis TaxID=1651941 RepID=A0AAW0Z066_9TREE
MSVKTAEYHIAAAHSLSVPHQSSGPSSSNGGHPARGGDASRTLLYPTSHVGREANDNNLKRRKLSPDVYEASSSSSMKPIPPSHTPSAAPLSTPPLQRSDVPTSALLYHFALSAHQASHRHLQQAFIPTSVSVDPNAGSPVLSLHTPDGPRRFVHDPEAANKALGLQLLALDLLKAGLADSGLSDRERVAFGLEFGIVGYKVYTGCKATMKGKGKSREQRQVVDLINLMDDVQDTTAQAYFVAQRQSSLMNMRLQLELLNARLAFVRGKLNLGKRMVQAALSSNRDNPTHRYALYLLYLEYIESAAPAELLSVVDELLNEAQTNNHLWIVQLAGLIKARSLFVHRRWELVPSVSSNLAAAIGWTDDMAPDKMLSGAPNERTWKASLIIHYLLMRTLWEGRIGNDEAAKSTMKKVYVMMDLTAEQGVFDTIRINGGVLKVTPPNIIFVVTYLTTVVSRREFTGAAKACRNLVHSKVMREKENFARADDMWDTGSTALISRSSFDEAHKLLLETVDHLDSNDLFHPLSPHLCLLFAQHAHFLGLDTLAVRYYRACKALINEGSELSLIAEIGQLGAENNLFDLLENPKMQDEVNALADKCKMSTSAMFTAAGHFLASLTDSNRVHSKKQLSTAYEISQRTNNNVLRLLIFAFTTSTHHYGGRERMLRQLETGRDISRLLGGKDRADGVGQTVLGLWFAYRLKEFNRQEGYQEGVIIARESIQAHSARLTEIRKSATQMALRMSDARRAVNGQQ